MAVKDGIVTPTGWVSSFAVKYAAVRAATRVKGVKAAVDKIEVRLPAADQRSDEELARAMVASLISHASVPLERVKAHVSDGWVTLEGTVEWYY